MNAYCYTLTLLTLAASAAAEPPAAIPQEGQPETIGFHKAVYSPEGKLEPWTTWIDAVDREMDFYLKAPLNAQGYPSFVYMTFMNDDYTPYKTDLIPCTQDGMGILSYLKYWKFKGESNSKVLEWAKKMGDYLVKESLTPDEGLWPRFTRSTGVNTSFPLRSSSQGDLQYGVNVIEPDKGGIAGYALVMLYDATKDELYLSQAVQNADLLAKNMRKGDAMHSPWPFRIDSVTGQFWGERSGDMVYILRLFDVLIAKGREQYKAPREALWDWIRTYQFAAPEGRDASLWIQFFEDMTLEDNRNSWSPLNMARYLIEKKEALDPDWKAHAEQCIQFAIKHFGLKEPGGVLAMVEQDSDMRPWGGACSNLGGVAAMFYAAGGGEQYKEIAYRNMTWMTYHIDSDGCPTHMTADLHQRRGGWQEDCHTDVIHNFMDALNAVQEWRDMRMERPLRIGFHEAKYDEQGKLLPWTSWDDAIDREMTYYLNCPEDHGYPIIATTTFMDGDYKPYRDDTIPCTLDGMGIITYLKYWEYRGKSNAKVLQWAKGMGNYLVKETLTRDEGAWPRFTRSTGLNTQFPMTESEQHDENFGPNVVEPDKGGIAGYALVKLYDATGDQRYLDQALQNARCLAKNMRPGDATHAPWPFRVDSVTGQGWGERNGNMAFILRLFDALIEKSNAEFQEPRDALWKWIKNVQIPAPEDQAHTLWIQFFEDHHEEDNRNSWAPLEMARYLIEKKEALDPEWKQDAERCIRFVLNNLSNTQLGYITTAVEQDYDKRDWGGVCSKLGGVTALFYAAGGGEQYKEMAYRNLNWCLYAIDEDGCPSHLPRVEKNRRGGWQEDCHTDVLLNFVDALAAVPEWRAAGK